MRYTTHETSILGITVDVDIEPQPGSCGKCPIAATRSSSSSAPSATLWELLEDSRLFLPDHQERALVWEGPYGSIRLSFGPLGDLLRIEEDEDREETAVSLLAAVAATVGAEDWRDVGWMVRELAGLRDRLKLTPVKWRWVLPDGYEIKESVVAEGDPETGEQHGERLVWSWRGRGETGDADNWRDALKEAWRHWAETDGEGEVGT